MPAVPAVSHVVHGQQWAWVNCRDRSLQTTASGQGAACVTRAPHVLGEDGKSILAGRLDDDVERFSYRHSEFIDSHGMDILAIHRHDRHFQAWNADIKVSHVGGVDEAQKHFFAGPEPSSPIVGRGHAVHQIGVSMCVDVGQVRWSHPHLAPCLAVGNRGSPTVSTHIADEVAYRGLVVVVVMRCLFQTRKKGCRLQVSPVREQHHVLAIPVVRRRFDRVDDHWPV